MATVEELRDRHSIDIKRAILRLVERMFWSRDRITALREERLRELLRVAKERSAWHRERMQHIDPAHFIEESLPRIPTMTKANLVEHFDRIVTDPRVTKAVANEHLGRAAASPEHEYLLERYHAVTSAGSSGVRGIFVYDWDAWSEITAANVRMSAWDRTVRGEDQLPVAAVVSAQDPTHLTAAFARCYARLAPVHRLPVTTPLREMVATLNELQPDMLSGYASMLGELASEAVAGRLRICLSRLVSTSDPLLESLRAHIERAFDAPVANVWGTSEAGPIAVGCYQAPGMHLSDDLVIVEPVDENNVAVPPGATSAKILLTNLFNLAQPLIRYELTDRVQVLEEPCPCGATFRRIADIEGRLEDAFRYGDAIVSPYVFRIALTRDPAVLEYQVLQTKGGAHILLRATDALDADRLLHEVRRDLERVGVPEPEVTVARVERFEKTSAGKVQRMVPLAKQAR